MRRLYRVLFTFANLVNRIMIPGCIGIRRKYRSFYKRLIIVILLLILSVLLFSYLNLEFCYKLMVRRSFNNMCSYYKDGKYSGALCEELCSGKSFKEFKCAENGIETTMFTAEKDHYAYEFQITREANEKLAWVDKKGIKHYPPLDEFRDILRREMIFSYNITPDEDVLKALASQEINSKSPEQMESIWRMFGDNHYLISKMYEEESIFPAVLGTCGPYYATEHLKRIHTMAKIKQFTSANWSGRLKFALDIMEFLHRLDQVSPEPLKMCKILPNEFGVSLTMDKRVRYKNAQFVYPESLMDKIISDGTPCEADSDCRHEQCVGKCNMKLKMCTGIQQNSNLQIVCHYIFKGYRYLPGILVTSKASTHLRRLLDICVDPSEDPRHHMPNRQFSPSPDITAKLYYEIRKIYNEETAEK